MEMRRGGMEKVEGLSGNPGWRVWGVIVSVTVIDLFTAICSMTSAIGNQKSTEYFAWLKHNAV
ncbi:hypothetical protein P152DRAFT_462106 [Eremomyces bilateralis CBS 781.70]|uniref:Uncharacterized protein n=1 Tax=Eremomyces bilateralis CBS 781.70 TaxID=1392243 RepID=A0A6G1FT43_9PEZI|nr:uncharacterized protein P152DRAFT_462106 [Eremomyces bilateralis CBS 781.70]KAF1808878.1 hypothetical protein P152DRAFT_462106 [Eremomyces bilateralis CBS 781.70]